MQDIYFSDTLTWHLLIFICFKATYINNQDVFLKNKLTLPLHYGRKYQASQ